MGALSEVLPQWQEIVTALDVPFHKIQSIQATYPSDYNRMSAGLNAWLQTRCSEPTWRGLLSVLADLKQEAAIQKVEKRMRDKYDVYIKQK